MWTIESHEDVERRLKRFSKKWKVEITNVLANLETMLEALKAGTKPAQLRHLGFVHAGYPLGILSIDQRGRGKGARLKPFRMYVFPDEEGETLRVITLGDKQTQEDDVRTAERYVTALICGGERPRPDEGDAGGADG